MGTDEPRHSRSAAATGRIGLLLVVLVFAVGGLVRFDRLGERSLWLDELSTWHVAQLDLAESLRWGPERTIGPLYQLCVRAVARDSRPPEWLLRLPAAVAGSLAVVAAWWLGRRLGGSAVGTGLAMLVALSQTQIHYSQEARPYSMLVLGSTLSVLLWHRLINRPARWALVAYTLVTALTGYAHFLMAFTLLGQVGWWVQRELRHPDRRRFGYACVALLAVAALCVPLAVRTLSGHADVTAALAWIEPPTALQAVDMLAEVTYGYGWLVVLLAAVLLAGARVIGLSRSRTSDRTDAPGASISLPLWWLGTGWIGLLLISLAVRPLLVPRYLLPATIPALLLPLLAARRFHRYAPLLLAAGAVGISLPRLYEGRSTPSLGFRELVAFLANDVDSDRAVVVNAIAGVEPEQAEMQRLAFRYYPLPGVPVRDWLVSGGTGPEERDVLSDPRRLHVVAFLADPLPTIHAAGRRIEPFVIDGTSYEQLVFGQYRLLKVAPQPPP